MPADATAANITAAADRLREAEEGVVAATAARDQARNELVTAIAQAGWRLIFMNAPRAVFERDGGTAELEQLVQRAAAQAAPA